MDDLISREAAVRIIADMHGLCRDDVLHESIQAIKELPAVDTAPMVHGEWIEVGTDIVCTNCKAAYDADVANLYRGEQDLIHYSGFEHCPHCGAKMDGERRDSE